MITARHIFTTASLLLALSAAPAFAQTASTATTTATKPSLFSGLFSSGNKQTSKNSATGSGNVAAINKSRTQRHIHTYMARNYDHRSGHIHHGQKGASGATTPASSSGGFFGRFKKSSTSQ